MIGLGSLQADLDREGDLPIASLLSESVECGGVRLEGLGCTRVSSSECFETHLGVPSEFELPKWTDDTQDRLIEAIDGMFFRYSDFEPAFGAVAGRKALLALKRLLYISGMHSIQKQQSTSLDHFLQTVFSEEVSTRFGYRDLLRK